MRLALLTNQIPPYRVATFAALRRKVDRLTVILSENRVAPGLEEADIEIRVARSLRIPSVRRHESGYFERYETHIPVGIVPALRAARPDCIFTAELGLRTVGAVLYRLGSRTPVVVHADLSEHTERGRGGLRPALRRLLLSRVDGVMVNGRSGADYIRGLGFPGRAISMLPYATDVERFGAVARLAGDPHELRLLYVGRLIELKGLEPWLAALVRELRERPERRVRFIVAGAGDRREAIEAIERPPNLRLQVHGQVPYADLPGIYADADVLVMPSLGDTWGLVVNEAMATGLPVIGSSQTQAVVEMVRDGVEGWIFSAEQPASVGAAIRRMLDTPRDRFAAMGADARRAALRLSPDHVATLLVDACRKARTARQRGSSATD